MISMVVGSPGAGKTYFALRAIRRAVLQRRPVVTNVALREDWPRRLVRFGGERLRPLVYHADDLDELLRVRVPGTREARALVVLDEAHEWLNARTWDAGAETRRESVQRRLDVVRWFSQHRKLGFDVLLISQDPENVDRQVRSLAEYHVQLRNLRKAVRPMGIPVVPVSVFVAVTSWRTSKTVVGREFFLLSRRVRSAYSTMGTHHVDEDQAQLIVHPGHALARGL